MALLQDLTVFGVTNLISDTFANNIFANGFHHNAHNNDDSVLLAGGGHKPIADFLPSTTVVNYVSQENSTTANWRGVILGYNSNASANTGISSTVSNVVYTTNNLTVQPSTGALSSKGRGTFVGVTSSSGFTSTSGDLIFNNVNHILWNSGSYHQRIFLTDDNTSGTAVFTFQQSTNTGSTWTDLFTIKDNGTLLAGTNTVYHSGNYASHLYIGAANAAANATSSNPYLKLYNTLDSTNTLKEQYQLSGSNDIKVNSDATGNITFSNKGRTVYFVVGTSTTAGTWLGSHPDITEYYDGLTVLYYINKAGASTTTLNINDLGAITCYYGGTTKLSTHYAVGSIVLLTYYDNGWRRCEYYSDTNTKIRTYKQITNNSTWNQHYPIIASRTLASGFGAADGNYVEVYGLIGSIDFTPTFNPITGAFKEGTDTKAIGNSSHAEGGFNIARGGYSHTEGNRTKAIGDCSHAEGGGYEDLLPNGLLLSGAANATQYTLSLANPSGTIPQQYQIISTMNTIVPFEIISYINENDLETNYAYVNSNVDIPYFSVNKTLNSSAITNHRVNIRICNGIAFGEKSHAEGILCNAIGEGSHAEGYDTRAIGKGSHAEGIGKNHSDNDGNYYPAEMLNAGLDKYGLIDIEASNYTTQYPSGVNVNIYPLNRGISYGFASHSEGLRNNSIGGCAHSEGSYTIAYGVSSHSEGRDSIAVGGASHAEGLNTIAYNLGHSEGYKTVAIGWASHVEGSYNISEDSYSHAEGYHTRVHNNASHTEGYYTKTRDRYAHAEGSKTIAGAESSHAEGCQSVTRAWYAHAEGYHTQANGEAAHAEGYDTRAFGDFSHAEGRETHVKSEASHGEGYGSIAFGDYSHAEGYYTKTSDFAIGGHAEGKETVAHGIASHAEGEDTWANGNYSHAEGQSTKARGDFSHVEGSNNIAEGLASHASGMNTKTLGSYSFATGWHTETNYPGEFVCGYYNMSMHNEDHYTLFSVGNGTMEYPPRISNAVTVWSDGDMDVFGNISNLSDISRKYNIQDLGDDAITNLFATENGFIREFTWNESNKVSYGFIAQEIENYCPEAVSYDASGLKVVNYNAAFAKIIGSMYKKIKELENEIDILKNGNH